MLKQVVYIVTALLQSVKDALPLYTNGVGCWHEY